VAINRHKDETELVDVAVSNAGSQTRLFEETRTASIIFLTKARLSCESPLHPRGTVSSFCELFCIVVRSDTNDNSLARTYRSRSRSSAGRVLHLVRRVVRPASRGCRRETGCRDGAASARPRPRCARANRTA